MKNFSFYVFIFLSSISSLAALSASSFADSSSCLVILQDSYLRDMQSLEELIFADGDQFVFQRIKDEKDKENHGQVFAQNKEEILALLAKQETRVASLAREGYRENVYVIQGGQSRLGRIAQKVSTLYGVRMLIDFVRLKDAAGSYYSFDKSIIVGLEDILYPNQLSKTLWHEVIHAKNDFESLVHLVIQDGAGESNPYPSFSLDELIAYEKNLLHIKNSKLKGQRVEGDRKNMHPRFFSSQEILKDLSRRTLAKKEEIMSLVSGLYDLEKNPKVPFQKIYKTLYFKDFIPEVKVYESRFLMDPLGSIPERYIDLYPHLRKHVFQGTPDEYRKDFTRRTHYSINLILKALEIAEKHPGESL